MGENSPLQFWEAWYPGAAATGLLIARCLIDPSERVLLHSAPDVLDVLVREQGGEVLARGKDLRRTAKSPICRLERQGDRITRVDIWPTEEDYGSVVLLPGGEAGVLQYWWNAPDQREWRWRVEFYNKLPS